MGENEQYSVKSLEKCSYRSLQQIAKSLNLPCNVKKVYLVQLIYAKKNLTESVVENLIQRVKLERKQLQNAKKTTKNRMHIQGTEISSTNNTLSPPISSTPKRPSILVRCKSPQQSYSVKGTSPVRQSDRVLRSFNVKTYRRPNYSIMNSMFGIDKDDDDANKPVTFHNECTEGNMSTCVLTKYRPSMLATSLLKSGTQKIVTLARSQSSAPPNRNPPVFPIQTRDAATNYNYVKSVGFRRKDGKISKINALVQKSKNTYIIETPSSQGSRKTNISIQDIINTSINSKSFSTSESTLQDFSIESGRQFLECTEDLRAVRDLRDDDARYPKMPVFDLTEAEATEIDINDPTDLSECRQTRQPKEQSENSNYPQILEQRDTIQQFNNAEPNNEVPCNNMDVVDCCNQAKLTEIYTNYPSLTNFTETATYQRPQLSKLPELLNMNKLPPASYTDDLPQNMETDSSETLTGTFSVHTHNGVEEKAGGGKEVEKESLPHINDAFTTFNSYKNIDRSPSVYSNYDRAGKFPTFMATSPVSALESLFNLRNDWLVTREGNRDTHCQVKDYTNVVYCTNFTVIPELSKSLFSVHFTYLHPLRLCLTCRLHRIAQVTAAPPNTGCSVPSPSTTESCMDCQDLGAAVSVTEMMEDALEVISQDGDYIERLAGMDERMQCVLCGWAGPKFILEIHVKKEHAEEIQKQTSGEWNVTFRLGSVVGRSLWTSRVMQLHGALYVLSVKYRDPDCLMASLTTISPELPLKTGSITVYNKVNGEPYSWDGVIKEIPINMPYENDAICLKLELSKLDLLPNSANLKLHNRQFVLTSPTKAVVGRPEFDNIQVTFFSKISD